MRVLRALYPLSCLYRNFMLAYLIEANAVITFASTGVRGMKYDGHPLIGPAPRRARYQACMRFLLFCAHHAGFRWQTHARTHARGTYVQEL